MHYADPDAGTGPDWPEAYAASLACIGAATSIRPHWYLRWGAQAAILVRHHETGSQPRHSIDPDLLFHRAVLVELAQYREWRPRADGVPVGPLRPLRRQRPISLLRIVVPDDEA